MFYPYVAVLSLCFTSLLCSLLQLSPIVLQLLQLLLHVLIGHQLRAKLLNLAHAAAVGGQLQREGLVLLQFLDLVLEVGDFACGSVRLERFAKNEVA